MKVGRKGVRVYNIDGTPVKMCPCCEKTLPLTEFAQDNSKTDGRTSFCKDCRNVYKKQYRSTGNGKITGKSYQNKRSLFSPEKDKAKAIISKMLSKGIITKPSRCEICGSESSIQGHHPDYSKPYEVYWLCKDCHAFVHSQAYKDI